MITVEQALDILRLDDDPTSTGLVATYVGALPEYIQTLTGVPYLTVINEPDPLLYTLEAFVIQLLYNPDGSDSERLQTVIDSLSSLVKARYVAGLYDRHKGNRDGWTCTIAMYDEDED